MRKLNIFFLIFLPSCASFRPPPAQEQPQPAPLQERPAFPQKENPPSQPPQKDQHKQTPQQEQPQPPDIEKKLELAYLEDLAHFIVVREQNRQELDAAYDCFTRHDGTISASPQLTALMEQFISGRRQAARLSSEVDKLYSTVPDDQTTVYLAIRSENPVLLEIACSRYNRKSAALVQSWAAYVNTVQAAKEAAAALQQGLQPSVSLIPVSFPQRSPP